MVCSKCGYINESKLGDLTLKAVGAEGWRRWRFRFRTTIRGLIQTSITFLLRISTIRDHMYILQHVIRSKGVGFDGWALPLLQFPAYRSIYAPTAPPLSTSLPTVTVTTNPAPSSSSGDYMDDSLLDHYAAMLMVNQ